MLVRDGMRREVITIERDASLRRARRVMENNRIRHLPVVEGRRLVGILTDRDIRLAEPSTASSLTFREREEFLDYLRVEQVMTRRLVAVTPDTPLADAARLLLRYRIGCLPVLEERLLVGILTTSDLLDVLARVLRAGVEEDRLEVDIPDGPDRLESLLRAAGALGARLLNLLSLPAGAGAAVRVALSVQGDPERAVAALGAQGFAVRFRPGVRSEDELIVEHLGRS